jgi:hypothetical protein
MCNVTTAHYQAVASDYRLGFRLRSPVYGNVFTNLVIITNLYVCTFSTITQVLGGFTYDSPVKDRVIFADTGPACDEHIGVDFCTPTDFHITAYYAERTNFHVRSKLGSFLYYCCGMYPANGNLSFLRGVGFPESTVTTPLYMYFIKSGFYRNYLAPDMTGLKERITLTTFSRSSFDRDG